MSGSPVPPRVPVAVDRAAAWSWRLLTIGAAVLATGFALARLRLVMLPLGVAFLLATALVPPVRWLARRGIPSLLATWLVILGFVGVLVGFGALIIPPLADEFGDLGPTLEEAADEVENWLVDGSLGIDQSTIDEVRDQLGDAVGGSTTADGVLLDGAVLAGEFVAGAVLTFVIVFFLVKDGESIQRWVLARIPNRHRGRARLMGTAAWSTLGRYLAGAATLGATEAAIIGITLAMTGGSVVMPVVALTFLGAFFPFVGAIVAGAIAILVTLVSSGPGAAVVVAIVVVLVQQFDNEILAPVIYGRALHLHPLVVILAVAAGAAIGGFLGAFLAVPIASVVINTTVAAAADEATAMRAGEER